MHIPIGREIGVSKNTARKYITQPAQPHGLKGVRKGSKLDPYKPQLDIWMQQGIFNCVVLLERLRALGYDGGMSILKEYVHPLTGQRSPRRRCGAMRRPAASRHKWIGASVSTRTKAGALHKVAVFVMILGYSRTKYIEFVSRCDLRSMERCMLKRISVFRGCT